MKAITLCIFVLMCSVALNSTAQTAGQPAVDTSRYSTVFLLFNSGNEDVKFRIFFNDKPVVDIRNHQRATIRLYSKGRLIIRREWSERPGKIAELTVEHGKTYGINIVRVNSWTLNPAEAYSTVPVTGETEVVNFLKKDFRKLKPFRKDDLKIVEDPKNPFN